MRIPSLKPITSEDIRFLELTTEEQQPLPEPIIVAEGDWGGQIYFSIPAKLVKSKKALCNALKKIDKYCWGCNGCEGCTYAFASFVYAANALCSGGMGGGSYGEDLWIHKTLEPFKKQIRAALVDGKKLTLPKSKSY